MITQRMRIRRQLRSARVTALTPEERREAIRAAERAAARLNDHPAPDAGAGGGVPPHPQAGAS